MTIPELRKFYYEQLVSNVVPFWLRHGRDNEEGGYFTCLNRDGSVTDTDKLCMWAAGRLIWVFSYLYNELEGRPEWLDFARHGVRFLERYGFDPGGAMYYALTREGRPLVPPVGLETERSTALGYTEFARATGEECYYGKARELMLRNWKIVETGGKESSPQVLWETRPVRRFANSMIVLNVAQQLALFRGEDIWGNIRKRCVDVILESHFDRSLGVVYENVGWDGSRLPGTMGRRVNPGHMIEGGIFLIHEGQDIGNKSLIEAGVEMIRGGFDRGWDHEFGGIFNDVDSERLPIPGMEVYLANAKLWWQHAEALYGLLLAWRVTGDDSFWRDYWTVHEYSFRCFADPIDGEWYAHLDRSGRRIDDAKGTERKNLFHIGRNFFWCFRLLGEWESNR